MSTTSVTSESAGTHAVNESASRANGWLTLSRAFAQPRLWHENLETDLCAGFGGAGDDEASALADAIAAARTDRESAELAHARLFLGPYDLLVPPYASFYLDADQRVMGPVSTDVAQWYTDAGLGPGAGPREAPDHVTCECEFMYFLGFQGCTTGDEAWDARQRDFWSGHLGHWLPQLLELLEKQTAIHPVYDALSRFADAFTQAEQQRLQPAPESP